jgi:DNA ligase
MANIYTLENTAAGIVNPYIGQRVRARWLRPWSGFEPGHEVSGILVRTFIKYGRICIGQIKTDDDGPIQTCPWSRNYLAVTVEGDAITPLVSASQPAPRSAKAVAKQERPQPISSSYVPMLAERYARQSIRSDQWSAEPKFDGVRCLVIGGKCVSRNLKPLNVHPQIQAWAEEHSDSILDSELYGGDWQRSITAARTGGEGTLWVFDCLKYEGRDMRNESLENRRWYAKILTNNAPTRIKFVLPLLGWHNVPEAMHMAVSQGYEGVMLKNRKSTYTGNRSEAWLKLKPLVDEDVQVTGMTEGKDGMTGTLGALQVRTKDGREFKVGGGFTRGQRRELWEHQQNFVGKWCIISEQPTKGMNVRHPQFVRFKDVTEGIPL